MDELCNILSDCSGQLINVERLSNIYKTVKHENLEKSTIERYVNLFIDAFIIREAKRYDIKGNKEIGALRKYYFVDNGLRNARLNFAYKDEGQMFENMIYNELIYNGYTVNIGTFDCVNKDKDGKSIRSTYEIDFIAKKGLKQMYIQVCNDYSSEITRERELKPFLKANNQMTKVIVVNKPLKETRDENGFTIIGAVDFMLRYIK